MLKVNSAAASLFPDTFAVSARYSDLARDTRPQAFLVAFAELITPRTAAEDDRIGLDRC